jgi:hypothetical protein
MVHAPCAPLPTPSDLQLGGPTAWAKAEAKSGQHRNASAAFAHPTRYSVSVANRRRSALVMTLTDDSDIASAAITGDSSTPMTG